ncbi:MAG: ATP-binding protein [Desulfomicrobium escambiense]|nr:ATP-binding protein [Desulfomicrobium escambiense]
MRAIEVSRTIAHCRPISGNPDLLREAFSNIFTNSLDHTPGGGLISVTLEDNATGCFVTICDSGPGIPEYAIGRVFERFYSLTNPRTGKKSSGLGLPLTREILMRHGGTVTLRNRDGGGLCCHIVLPYRSVRFR